MSVKCAQVMIDTATGQSKKYGFVRFYDQVEQARAQQEMNGQMINGRAIRCGPAQPKNAAPAATGYEAYGAPPAAAYGAPPAAAAGYEAYGAPPAAAAGYEAYGAAAPAAGYDYSAYYAYQGYPPGPEGYPPGPAPTHPPTTIPGQEGNATVFIGGLDGQTGEEALHQTFVYFGPIKTCRVPDGKNCGFVEFHYPQSAEQAIATMHQQYIGASQVRCEWGKSRTGAGPAAQPDYSAQWQEYYAQQAQQAADPAAQQQAAAHAAAPAAANGGVPGPQLPPHPAAAAPPPAKAAVAAKPAAHVDGVTCKLDVEQMNTRYISANAKFLTGTRLAVVHM